MYVSTANWPVQSEGVEEGRQSLHGQQDGHSEEGKWQEDNEDSHTAGWSADL